MRPESIRGAEGTFFYPDVQCIFYRSFRWDAHIRLHFFRKSVWLSLGVEHLRASKAPRSGSNHIITQLVSKPAQPFSAAQGSPEWKDWREPGSGLWRFLSGRDANLIQPPCFSTPEAGVGVGPALQLGDLNLMCSGELPLASWGDLWAAFMKRVEGGQRSYQKYFGSSERQWFNPNQEMQAQTALRLIRRPQPVASKPTGRFKPWFFVSFLKTFEELSLVCVSKPTDFCEVVHWFKCNGCSSLKIMEQRSVVKCI